MFVLKYQKGQRLAKKAISLDALLHRKLVFFGEAPDLTEDLAATSMEWTADHSLSRLACQSQVNRPGFRDGDPLP